VDRVKGTDMGHSDRRRARAERTASARILRGNAGIFRKQEEGCHGWFRVSIEENDRLLP
jgi:hypothetical protein